MTVTFTINDMSPVVYAGTKALGENADLSTLHLAVFGSSGYLKEYVTAVPVKMGERKVYTVLSGDSSTPVEVQVDQYTFTATLSLAESRRYVHLIGNGPDVLDFGYDNQVLPSLLCSDGAAVFWQMIELPNGIRAKQDDQLRYLYYDGTPHLDEDNFNKPFMPDDATTAAFNGNGEGIPMVRNWAKLELTADPGSHFTPYSFVAVNVPRQGTYMPYSGTRKIIDSYPTGFITGYQDLSFTTLDKTLEYAGNLPSSVYLNTNVPNRMEFETPTGWAVDVRETHAGTWNDPNPGFYMYERPIPSNEMLPTYVLVYGHYKNDDDSSQAAYEGDYFYKIDLMEGNRYYPIYRNFKYEINIRNISAPGFDTPQAAMLSAGSGDVSSNINASGLLDISDGTRRLVIRPWLEQLFTEAQSEVTVFAAFYSNLSVSSSPETTNCFSLELMDPDDGDTEHPVIIGPTLGAAAGEGGFWPITFSTPDPVAYRRSQTLRVNATSGGVTMYRDISITVQGIQPMKVVCQNHSIPRWQGSPQVVDILIPNGLPRSMFSSPLEFTVEAEDLTLSPDNSYTDNNLPVVRGTSITENYAGQAVFQFVRSLSWTDYRALPLYTDSNQVTWRRISCYFKSNCDLSATRVWVYNEFFDKASDAFVNHDTFGNVKFTTSIPLQQDATVKVNVSVPMMGDAFPQVRLILKNLTPVGTALVSDDDTEREDDYLWTPTAESTEFSFTTSVSTGDVALDLSAVDGSLEPLSLKPWKFSSGEFVAGRKMLGSTSNWSNVVRGHVNKTSKQALFGYMDDPDAPDAPITIKNLTNLTLNGLPSSYATVPFVPLRVGTWQPYHQFNTTSKNSAPASFTISSVGYVDYPVSANCFNGDLTPYLASTDDVFRPGNNKNFTVANPTYAVSQWSRSCRVTFDKVSAIQSVDPAGVVLDAGGEYKITVTSLTSGHELVQIAIDYLADYDWYGTVQDMMPASIVSSTGGSSVIRYPGNRATQIVVIPTGGIMESTITLRAPADHPIVITAITPLSFKGTLLD